MEILVAPISRDLFPAQISALIQLCEQNYKPTICFVGSGGSVATYVGKAGQWNSVKILDVCSHLHTGMFVTSWLSSTINIFPSSILAVANGSFYKTTDLKAEKLLSEYLCPQTFKKTEIWE